LVDSRVWCFDRARVLHFLLFVVQNELVSVNFGVVLLDDLVIRGELLVHGVQHLVLPNFFDFVEVLERLLDSLAVRVFSIGSQDLIDVGERVGHNIHEEVVHKISVITLECNSRWLNSHRIESDSCVELDFLLFCVFLLLHELLSIFIQIFRGELAKLVISHEDFKVVKQLNIHLNIKQNIEIASG
jgi:hypothetical protein